MSSLIADNRKARHLYELETRWEAGIVLHGWEVKSLRAGKAQISDSYVVINRGEPFLINAHIAPLQTVSTHLVPEPTRPRKLLLHKTEVSKLIGALERKGYTMIPLNLHWRKNLVKVEIALAKGKALFDKRQVEKERSWQREKQRLTKYRSSN